MTATGEVTNLEGGVLDDAVSAVFEAMLGLNVIPVHDAVQPAGADRLTAAVHLAGSWSGAVVLETSLAQACKLAGRYLSVEPPPAVDDDVRDVLAELVNMIGGNLKSALCPGAMLSIPAVIDGSHYRVRLGDGRVEQKQAFSCAEGVLWVFRIGVPAANARG